jgi:transposase
MQVHLKAKLGPAGRLALCQKIEDGMTFRQAAACLNVSLATAHRWWHRYRVASLAERRSLGWAADRSSRPRHSPRLLKASAQAAICEARRHTGWGPRLVAGATGHPHSTVWKVLHRHGLSRRPRQPRDAARRYEWPCPGDLLHIDTKRYARFERPGHAVTGIASRPALRSAPPGAMTSPTRSSTITPAWPMSSFCRMSWRPRSPRS